MPPRFLQNPVHEKWIVQDKEVLNYLFSSLSRDIMSQVVVLDSSATVWAAIEAMFASQSRARVIKTGMVLVTASKGASAAAEFFIKMKGLTDEMASIGKKFEDEELVSYILTGLDIEYNPLVSAISARVEPISLSELYTQLISFESRLDLP